MLDPNEPIALGNQRNVDGAAYRLLPIRRHLRREYRDANKRLSKPRELPARQGCDRAGEMVRVMLLPLALNSLQDLITAFF